MLSAKEGRSLATHLGKCPCTVPNIFHMIVVRAMALGALLCGVYSVHGQDGALVKQGSYEALQLPTSHDADDAVPLDYEHATPTTQLCMKAELLATYSQDSARLQAFRQELLLAEVIRSLEIMQLHKARTLLQERLATMAVTLPVDSLPDTIER